MALYIAKRLLLALLVALAVSIIGFALLRLSGDVAIAVAGSGASTADIEFIRTAYGFDRPLAVQYLDWLGRTLTGDFGQSLYFRQDVAGLVLGRLPVTVTLGASALILALLVAVPLGVAAATRPNSWIDRLALLLAVAGQTLPSFWLSLVLIMIFAVSWRVLPVSGSESWKHFVLPSIALAIYALPALMRLTRAGMIDVLATDYIRAAPPKACRG
jgi:peptide/nickel transport system permease protein